MVAPRNCAQLWAPMEHRVCRSVGVPSQCKVMELCDHCWDVFWTLLKTSENINLDQYGAGRGTGQPHQYEATVGRCCTIPDEITVTKHGP